MTKLKTFFFAASALTLLGVSACKDPSDGTGGGNIAPPDAPLVEGGVSLILSPDKLDITVTVITSDGTPVTVEGCTETTIPSGTETVLHAKGTKVILKGKITELEVGDYFSSNSNKLTALNVQGLNALKRLGCCYNKLTALNVQGLNALQTLYCWDNQLTALNVQGCTALQELHCHHNQLTALNVQGLTALLGLYCHHNQLTELNVQGLALKGLYCGGNQLTALNVQGLNALQVLEFSETQLNAIDVQGLTALQWLWCYNNRVTALNVQGLTALQRLYCDDNQLAALNVQGCTALQSLLCFGNRLTADAFKKLFDDLPLRADSDNASCYLYSERTGHTEGNHTDFTDPSDLAGAFNNAKTVKKWKMYKVDADGQPVGI